MDNTVWRTRAHTFAIIDIVLQCVNIIGFIIIVVLLVGGSKYSKIIKEEVLEIPDVESKNDDPENPESIPLWLMLVTFGLLVIFIGLELWAAICLFVGTKIGREPNNAMRYAKIWRNVTLIILVLSLVECVFSFSSRTCTSMFVSLIFRGTGLYIVKNFIVEQEGIRIAQSANQQSFKADYNSPC